jgi:acetoin utilization protein AcuB
MNIRKRMQTEIVTLQVDEPLANAVEATSSERIRHLPILDGERLVGMVSDRDIKRALPSAVIEGNKAEYDRVLNETPVRRIMRGSPITVGPTASLADVTRLMLDHRISAIPVVEGGKLVGLLTDTDVLQAFLEVLETLE